jgi:hypothetical protein
MKHQKIEFLEIFLLGFMIRFIGLFDTAYDCILRDSVLYIYIYIYIYIYTHTLLSTVTSLLLLLGIGF